MQKLDEDDNKSTDAASNKQLKPWQKTEETKTEEGVESDVDAIVVKKVQSSDIGSRFAPYT